MAQQPLSYRFQSSAAQRWQSDPSSEKQRQKAWDLACQTLQCLGHDTTEFATENPTRSDWLQIYQVAEDYKRENTTQDSSWSRLDSAQNLMHFAAFNHNITPPADNAEAGVTLYETKDRGAVVAGFLNGAAWLSQDRLKNELESANITDLAEELMVESAAASICLTRDEVIMAEEILSIQSQQYLAFYDELLQTMSGQDVNDAEQLLAKICDYSQIFVPERTPQAAQRPAQKYHEFYDLGSWFQEMATRRPAQEFPANHSATIVRPSRFQYP